MGETFLSIEEAARRLQLHVKTVRAYVREGRLKATRIGKQYRIAREDFEAFTGQTLTAESPVGRTRHVEVASVVEIDAIDRDQAMRITNTLVALANGRRGETEALRLEAIYDEERAKLRIVVIGGLRSAAHVLNFIGSLLES